MIKNSDRNERLNKDSTLAGTLHTDGKAASGQKTTPSTSTMPDTDITEATEAATGLPKINEAPVDSQAPVITASSSMGSETNQLGQTPPRTLRPLRLVEKRHSLTNGQSLAMIANQLSANDSPEITEAAGRQAEGPSAAAPLSSTHLASVPGAGSINSTPRKGSPIGLGLGLPLNPPSTRPVGNSIASPVLSADFGIKYHPASAFDPPPRVPSISVTGLQEDEDEDDGCIPHDESKGVSLRIGIPCVIYVAPSFSTDSATSTPVPPRARLKASCRYIGQVDGKKGEWIGVEINKDTLKRARGDLIRDAEEPLSVNGQHDGTWNGVRYYKISKTSSSSARSSPMLSRPTSPLATQYRSGRVMSGRSLFSGGPPSSFDTGAFSPRLRGNSLANTRRGSPSAEYGWDGAMSFMSNPETSWAAGKDMPSDKCGLWIRPSDVVFVPGAQHE
jgi:hypothetical protein